MDDRVTDVGKLHNDTYSLFNNVVIGGAEYSSDTIIANLATGIENLKNTWKGKDAGVQIENIVKVYNGMVNIRNVLVDITIETSKIVANYREIQNANGAGFEGFGIIRCDKKSFLPDYVDNADTINITSEANNGKIKIDAASNAIDQFISESKRYYTDIMQNWIAGNRREEMIANFDAFISGSNRYKEVLNSVSQSIRTALANYGL